MITRLLIRILDWLDKLARDWLKNNRGYSCIIQHLLVWREPRFIG